MKRALCVLVAALAAGGLTACGSDDDEGGGSSPGRDSVKVQLDYVPRGNHAMFYVGKEKGFFEKHDIDVGDINVGTGSPAAMRSVGRGQADFGFGDLPTLATAASQGVPVVALAGVNQHSPLGLCTLAEKNPLRTPGDLRGKTIGLQYSGSTFIFYKALLALNKVPRDAVKEQPVTPPYENFLLQGKVDAVICYVDAEVPVLETAAKKQDRGPLSKLLGADFGFDAFGSGLVTSRKLIQQKPDVVRRFVAGYMEAFQWVIDHPDEAAKIVSEARPELKPNAPVFRAQLQADIERTFTSDTTERHGLGYMDPKQWRDTVDLLHGQKVIERAPKPETLYDNSFVEQAAGKKKR